MHIPALLSPLAASSYLTPTQDQKVAVAPSAPSLCKGQRERETQHRALSLEREIYSKESRAEKDVNSE